MGNVKSAIEVNLTHKFFGAGEVEELHESKIISGDHVEPGVRNTGAVHVCLLCVTRPDAQNLVPQNTVQEEGVTSGHWRPFWGQFTAQICPHLVQVAQVIRSIRTCSVTIFPLGTSWTWRLYEPVETCTQSLNHISVT